MKKLLKEPLLHFLVIGAALFGLNASRHKAVTSSTPRIEVTAAVIKRLSASYERQFGHAPDENELRGLVAAQIREEVRSDNFWHRHLLNETLSVAADPFGLL